MSSITNSSYSKGREEVEYGYCQANDTFPAATAIYIALFLVVLIYSTIFVLVVIYSEAKLQTKSEEGKKPIAYFQFWAFHLFFIPFLLYTIIDNVIYKEDKTTNPTMITLFLGAINVVTPVIIADICCGRKCFKWFDIETPTHLCSYCHSRCTCFSHYSLLCLSMFTFSLFIIFSIITIPTLVFIYYLYPIRTLARLPLLVSEILYINTLLGLLIFQYERLVYVCCKKCCKCNIKGTQAGQGYPALDELDDHDAYYTSETENKNNLISCSHFILPIGTVLMIAGSVMFLVMTTELSTLNRNTEDENFKMLLTLVPTLVLLYGFWVKSEAFCGVSKRKKKETNREGYKLIQNTGEETE